METSGKRSDINITTKLDKMSEKNNRAGLESQRFKYAAQIRIVWLLL